jgi:SAM-dependent methyltransferase
MELRDAWPARVTVTEEYPPNFQLATDRLTPLGVRVASVRLTEIDPLPFGDAEFDVVLNRHSAFNCAEVARVLAPGGTFLTQQVHGRSAEELQAAFGVEPLWPDASPDRYVPRLAEAGLDMVNVLTWTGRVTFSDVGALVYYLRAVPWIVPGFSVATHQESLLRLQQRLDAGQAVLTFPMRLYLIEAKRGLDRRAGPRQIVAEGYDRIAETYATWSRLQVVDEVRPRYTSVLLDQQSAGSVDDQGQQVVRRDEVGVDGQPQDAQACVQVMVPDRRVPVRRAAFEQFGAPDVVDQDVDVAVVCADLLGQFVDLFTVEVVDLGRDAETAQIGDQGGCLFDGFGSVVLRAMRAAGATGADHGRAGFAERHGDATASAARCAGNDGQPTAERSRVG